MAEDKPSTPFEQKLSRIEEAKKNKTGDLSYIELSPVKQLDEKAVRGFLGTIYDAKRALIEGRAMERMQNWNSEEAAQAIAQTRINVLYDVLSKLGQADAAEQAEVQALADVPKESRAHQHRDSYPL